jgi:uncharacterized membrane protein
MTAPLVTIHPLSPTRAHVRLILSLTIGVIAARWVSPTHFGWWLRGVAGWDAASLALAALAWSSILTAGPAETRHRAGTDDPGRSMLFLIAVTSSLVSLLTAVVVLRLVKRLPPGDQVLWTVLALAAVVLSWTVTHTSYTLRYASLYYRQRARRAAPDSGSLKFPGTDDPADIDFAYFAFTIAMCFQVSDVVVMTTQMRREVLLHSVLSFVYNTAIVALALNVIIGALS